MPLDSRIPPGNKGESWPLSGNKDGFRALPRGEDDSGGSRALPGGRGGTIIIPIDIGPIVSVVASFTF